jgi:hypothetical protein
MHFLPTLNLLVTTSLFSTVIVIVIVSVQKVFIQNGMFMIISVPDFK